MILTISLFCSLACGQFLPGAPSATPVLKARPLIAPVSPNPYDVLPDRRRWLRRTVKLGTCAAITKVADDGLFDNPLVLGPRKALIADGAVFAGCWLITRHWRW